MTTKKTCECKGTLVRRRYKHVQDVAGVKVSDESGLARVCSACGEATLSMEELSRYERAAAAMVAHADDPAMAALTSAVLAVAAKLGHCA